MLWQGNTEISGIHYFYFFNKVMTLANSLSNLKKQQHNYNIIPLPPPHFFPFIYIKSAHFVDVRILFELTSQLRQLNHTSIIKEVWMTLTLITRNSWTRHNWYLPLHLCICFRSITLAYKLFVMRHLKMIELIFLPSLIQRFFVTLTLYIENSWMNDFGWNVPLS